MWFDLHYYLPDDILVKVDRMSMAHTFEVRCLYLDQCVAEMAFNLPPGPQDQARDNEVPIA